MGLNCVGTLTQGFFFNNMYSTVNIFSLLYDFLNNIFFSLAYFIVQVQYIIYKTYKIRVNQLFVFLVRVQVNSRLLVVKVLHSQKLYAGFHLSLGSVPLTHVLFKGQLHIIY